MKLELKIVNLLARNMESQFTINEISKTLGEYYSFVHRTISKLANDGVINKNKIGRSYICSLNLRNERTRALMQLGEIEKRDEFYNKNKKLELILDDFTHSLLHENEIMTIILFGSYAKENATEDSDIDILVISRNRADIGKAVKEAHARYGKEINPIATTPADFRKQKDKPAIKDIIKNHYILYGSEIFIELVFKDES